MLQDIKKLIRYIRIFLLRGCAGREKIKILCTGGALILAPHPDDEIFGSGGLIALKRKMGARVVVVYLTDGGASHLACCGAPRAEIVRQRESLAREVGKIVGLEPADQIFLGWADGEVPISGRDGFEAAVAAIADCLKLIAPGEVYCPHPFEGWSDHAAAEQIAREALRRSPLELTLFHYCVWFWVSMPFFKRGLKCDWRNARVLDLGAAYSTKQAAIDLYMSARADCGNPVSGDLPEEFLQAQRWRKELFFKVDMKG
jgi:LmbE family N-acetylglucosaminyl deacetylase